MTFFIFQALTVQKESIRASQRKPKNIDFSSKNNTEFEKRSTNFEKSNSIDSTTKNHLLNDTNFDWEKKASENIKKIHKLKIDTQIQIREKKKSNELTSNLKCVIKNFLNLLN